MFVPRDHILQSTFALKPGKNKASGTCFTYPANGFFYFITAAHVIKSMPHAKENQVLSIYRNNFWEEILVTPYFASKRSYIDQNKDIDVDIAVLKTSIPTDLPPWIELSWENAVLGQDVYFLGFPYFDASISYKAEILNRDFPLPLVKKATLSSFLQQNGLYFYLDGHNNPGFSGGPVTFWDTRVNKQKVLGVITDYLSHPGNNNYSENSGIALAYNIKYAKDIIDEISAN